MENILIMDIETNGLSVTENDIIEIGAILFHIPTRAILAQVSTLFYSSNNDAYEINLIEVESLNAICPTIQQYALDMIKKMMIYSDVIVAHNAEFDRSFIEKVKDLKDISQNTRWICTKNDVKWPVRKGCPLNLVHICADLGVPIIFAHRALSDCRLLMEAINCIEDIPKFLDRGSQGLITYRAQISYEQRQLAKDHGFQWDVENKVWFSKLTKDEALEIPFLIYPVENV